MVAGPLSMVVSPWRLKYYEGDFYRLRPGDEFILVQPGFMWAHSVNINDPVEVVDQEGGSLGRGRIKTIEAALVQDLPPQYARWVIKPFSVASLLYCIKEPGNFQIK